MRAVVLLCLFGWLAVLAVVNASAEKTDSAAFTSSHEYLSDWLDSLSASSTTRQSAAVSKYAYPERTIDHACYKMLNTCGGEYPFTYWSSLTCCPAPKSNEFILIGGSPQVGSCFMDWPYFPALYEYADNVVATSNFGATCTLEGTADTCGPSGCGDITLSAQGPAFILLSAITDVDPSAPAIECPGRFDDDSRTANTVQQPPLTQQNLALRNPLLRMPNITNKAKTTNPAPSAASAGTPASLQYYASAPHQKLEVEAEGNGDTVVWQTQVLIYSGPMTISAKHHKPKWSSGFFELTVPWTVVEPGRSITLAEVAAQEAEKGYKFPRIRSSEFYNYKLKLYRDETGYGEREQEAEHY